MIFLFFGITPLIVRACLAATVFLTLQSYLELFLQINSVVTAFIMHILI